MGIWRQWYEYREEKAPAGLGTPPLARSQGQNWGEFVKPSGHLRLLTLIILDWIVPITSVMGGKTCIRGMRVTVGTVVGLLTAGRSHEEILKAYPYLEREDIDQALAYAAWRVEEREVALVIP